MNRRHRSWALRSQASSTIAAGRLELLPVRLRHAVQVEERDGVVAGVVEPPTKTVSAGHGQPARGQPLADPRVVEHLGHGPGVRPAGRAAAGAAVVGRVVRVVQAVRAVPEQQHQPGEPGRQPDVAEQPLGDVGHLVDGEADAGRPRGRASASARSSCSRVSGGVWTNRPNTPADPRRQPREEDAGDQRDRGQHPDGRRSAAPPGRSVRLPTWNRCDAVPSARRVRARRRWRLVRPRRPPPRHPVLRAGSRPGRAARSGRRPRRGSTSPRRRTRPTPNVSHVGASSSRWRRNDSSRSSRQKTTWNRGAAAGSAAVGRAGRGRRASGWEPPLVGEVEDPPPLERRERLDLPHERRPLGRRQPVQVVGRPAEDLGELEDEEGPLLDARRPRAADPRREPRPAARRAGP